MTTDTTDIIALHGSLKIELDAYQVLDGSSELSGEVTLKLTDAPNGLHLQIKQSSWPDGAAEYAANLALHDDGKAAFAIPLSDESGGYHRVEATLLDADENPIDIIAPEVAIDRLQPHRPDVFFAVRDERSSSAVGVAQNYLRFVSDTIELLREQQSARAGGDGTLCITTSNWTWRRVRFLGKIAEGGRRGSLFTPDLPPDIPPRRLDLQLWGILDRLTALTGDTSYGDMVTEMAQTLLPRMFHPRSGLGYMGEESDFDVVTFQPLPTGPRDIALFKPGLMGTLAGLPLARLWRHAPQQTARMFKAAWYGLVTEPRALDFNRQIWFDFDDSARKHVREPSPHLSGIASSGARLVHWWSSCFCHTGDEEALHYAQRMIDKWRAVQHPETGLVPESFGGRRIQVPSDEVQCPPKPYCATRDAVVVAQAWLDAVEELEQCPTTQELAGSLREMARHLAHGLANYSFCAQEEVFYEYLHLDGRRFDTTASYQFYSAEEKAAAVRRQPELADVPIFHGISFYENGPRWTTLAGSETPMRLANAARRLGDKELANRLVPLLSLARTAARSQDAPFTRDGYWTWSASAYYIKAYVDLFHLTGEPDHLLAAREIADGELERLNRVRAPHWWRLRERTFLLDALLSLAEVESLENREHRDL